MIKKFIKHKVVEIKTSYAQKGRAETLVDIILIIMRVAFVTYVVSQLPLVLSGKIIMAIGLLFTISSIKMLMDRFIKGNKAS